MTKMSQKHVKNIRENYFCWSGFSKLIHNHQLFMNTILSPTRKVPKVHVISEKYGDDMIAQTLRIALYTGFGLCHNKVSKQKRQMTKEIKAHYLHIKKNMQAEYGKNEVNS